MSYIITLNTDINVSVCDSLASPQNLFFLFGDKGGVWSQYCTAASQLWILSDCSAKQLNMTADLFFFFVVKVWLRIVKMKADFTFLNGKMIQFTILVGCVIIIKGQSTIGKLSFINRRCNIGINLVFLIRIIYVIS